MKKVILLILSICLFTGCHANKELKEKDASLKIMVVSDTHYLASSLHDGGTLCESLYQLRDGKIVQYGREIISALVDIVLEEKPDALLLTGDLTFNGEKESHIELAKLLQPLVVEGIHVLVMPGNHDINNPFAYSFTGEEVSRVDTVQANEFKNIYDDFGYNLAEMKDDSSLSYVYKLSEDIWFMMVDTNRYELNSGLGLFNNGKVREETLDWMEECFIKAKKEEATVILSTHHTLLDNEYLFTSEYQVRNADEVKELMSKYDVSVNLSGHIHTQSIISNTINDDTLYDITTGALSVTENLYGIITIENNIFTYEAIPLDVSKWAYKNQLTDKNLLNFHDYSWQFYHDVTYTQFLGTDESNIYNEEIAQLFAYINPYYFSGRIDEVRDEVLKSEVYDLIQGLENTFSSVYLDSILSKRELNQRKIEIVLE